MTQHPTQQLSRLLHETGDDLAVPPPPSDAVLADGRRRRRRRTTLTTGAASLAVVAVVGAALLVPGAATDRDGLADDRTGDPVAAPADPTFEGVTYAVDDRVFLDGGDEVVTIDDGAVKSLYYSSAGVVVRHGDNAMSDGGGPQRFTLVRPDGTTSPISVTTEETVPGVDATQPYLAWAEATPGGAEVVVRDVDTDTEVARVPVDGEFSWSPPPVALSGDTVYVGGRSGNDANLLAVDWRTGRVSRTDLSYRALDLSGGRAVLPDLGADTVVDVDSGEVLHRERRTIDVGPASLALSPTGRYAVTVAPDTWGADGLPLVVDLDDGSEVELEDPRVAGKGFSSEDRPFTIVGGEIVVCDPDDGSCTTKPVDVPDGAVQLYGGLFPAP